MSDNLGAYIKAARQEAGRPQVWLARAAGLKHQQTVLKIENGSRGLSFAEGVTVARALGISLETLADQIPETAPEKCSHCGGEPPTGFRCNECGESR